MSKKFYRFRRINNLIGEFKELENQTIYFAHPNDLNDPMEGFRDVYWQGDKIIWKNLFKHFLFCLERLCFLMLLSKEDHLISENDIPIFSGGNDFPTLKYKELFLAIAKKYFENKNIVELIDGVSLRSTPIRRDELFFYLNYAVYPFALEIIFSEYENFNLIPTRKKRNIFADAGLNRLAKDNFISTLEKSLEGGDQEEKIADAIFSGQRHIHNQMDFIHRYNGTIDTHKKNRNLVLFEFAEVYINQLEKLVYPEWYTACFMTECSNSSVWGNYGENHTGICLIFNSEIEDNDNYLNLNGIHGWDSNGAVYGIHKHKLYPIDYINGFGQIDFFRSLGKLPIPTLNAMWYFDAEKIEMSKCAENMNSDVDKWREKYWENFYRDITIKSKDWEYEKEYRMILYSDSFSKKEHRNLTYDFNSLEGLIFGIRTKKEDKINIIKIIEKKCIEHKRNDFKFYQARYSHDKKCIVHSEMSFLNLRP